MGWDTDKKEWDQLNAWDRGGGQWGQLWTPQDITTQVWFDASDLTTITATANKVSQWNDKSGNARNLVQLIGANQPYSGTRTINGLNTLDFSPTDAINSEANATWLDGTSYTIVAVSQADITNNYNYMVGTDGGSDLDETIQFGWSSSTAFHIGHYGDDAEYSGLTPTLNPTLYTAKYNSPGSALWINAVSKGTDLDPTDDVTITSKFRIGGRWNRYWDGMIAEVVVVTGTFSTADCQSLEGYLAWKWGTQGDLPVTHPYKQSPPTR